MKKILVLPALVLGLIACSPEVKSVDHYMNNLEEAQEVIDKCEVTQGSVNDQNCINAKDAIYRDHMNKLFSGY